MRLTKKDKNGNYYTTGEDIKKAYPKLGQLEDLMEKYHIENIEELETLCKYAESVKDWMSIYKEKMYKIKDIEEELGIDLLTLFKALEGIYIKPNNIYVGSPYLCFAENENRELEFQFKIVDTWYKVKDYGKTWALTKEVLL